MIRGPGFVIWDSAVRMEFRVTERAKVTFSSEFYNFLNHTNWSSVGTAFGGGTFGRVTSARDPRKVRAFGMLQRLSDDLLRISRTPRTRYQALASPISNICDA